MRRVLVARLDSDGDVLLAGPAVRAVAASGRRVTLLCGPRGAAAARLLPGVDEVLVHRAPWIDPDGPGLRRGATAALVARLARRRIADAAILTSFHQSALPLALLLRVAGARRIAAISEDFPGSLLDLRLADPGDVPEAERALGVVAALGHRLPPGDDGRLAVRLPRRDEAPEAPAGCVVVHPGASVPARAWAPEHHAELVSRLAQAGERVVVTGGPGERELAARVAGPPRPEVLNLAGRTSLGGLARVLARASAVVCGNTGPAHLAAAVGTPVVSLFAATVPSARWAPWGVRSIVLEEDVPCAGCRARRCPVPGHPCLSRISPGEVLDALGALRTARPSPSTEVPA